jgi:hypothetical protein
MPARLNMFTFGYWGWGSATRELVRSLDAVERRRGFRSPIFVDVRIHRGVRATGFRDDAFEQLLGRARYRWMRGLGNLAVVGRSGGRRVKIKSPAAATELLEFAREAARQHRRVIFFCGCPYPGFCHRHAVSQLLLRYARARGINLRISEWPGGKPTAPATQVPLEETSDAQSVRLPLRSVTELARVASLAYGTLVRVRNEKSEQVVPIGPARYAKKGWYLPVLRNEDGSSVRGTPRAVEAWRKRYGYLPIES